jgi:hypothetical protein
MSDSAQPTVGLKEAMRLTKARLSRLSWALETYGHLIPDAVRADTSLAAREAERLPMDQIPKHVARSISDVADPTKPKTMTGWLIKQYAEGRLRLEDLGSANDTLTMFEKHSKKLPKGKQDLGQYPSLAAVWEAVIGFANVEEQHLSGKAQKALERDKAYTESRILRQDPDGFTVAVPLTESAAKWWGKGTRWCTSAEKDNGFRHYHQKAPLIVFVIPELKEKGKFQIWVTEQDVQFMDAADQSPPEDLVAEYWPRFEPIISFALRENGGALHYVPEDLRTEEMCRNAVAQDGAALEYIPEHLRTEEICRIAVAKNGGALYHVPQRLRTEEMCRIAVAQDGGALVYVPEHLRTEEICRIAVAQHGRALEHVPEALRTDDLYKIAVAQNWRALRNVPEKRRTDEMCRIAVAQNGWALEYVPQKLRTDEMCSIAVAQNGWALRYVPEKLRTDGMCRIAVARDGGALESVPEQLRTEDMCRIAVAQHGEALWEVPETLRTEEMCKIAVAQNWRALPYVPAELRMDEMCRIAVAQNGCALDLVPEALRTEEIYRIAITQTGEILQRLPEHLRTEEMCRIAVAQNARALHHVPSAVRNRISALIPPPVPGWDIALLDDMVSFLGTGSSPAPSGPRHA